MHFSYCVIVMLFLSKNKFKYIYYKIYSASGKKLTAIRVILIEDKVTTYNMPMHIACLLQNPIDRTARAYRTTSNNTGLSQREVNNVKLILSLLLTPT